MGSVLVAAMLVVGMITGGAAVVYASDGAGPGDLLYGVDRAVEDVRLEVASDYEQMAELLLDFAEERLEEAEEALEEGSTEEAEEALAAFDEIAAVLQSLLAGGALDDDAGAVQKALAGLQKVRETILASDDDDLDDIDDDDDLDDIDDDDHLDDIDDDDDLNDDDDDDDYDYLHDDDDDDDDDD